MKPILILFILPFVFLYFSPVLEVEAQLPWGDLDEDDENGTSDEDFLKKFDELGKAVICKAMSNDSEGEGGIKLNLKRPMSLEEVTYLTFLNKARNLRTSSLTFPEDLKWRRKLINKMYGIFTHACPNKFVPHGYMNLLRELIMIYYNSIEERGTNNTEVWDAFLETLESCANNKERIKYEYSSSGLRITGLIFEKKKSEAEAIVGGPIISGGDEKGDMDGRDDKDTDSDEDGLGGRKDGDSKVKMGVSISRQQESADSLPLDLVIDVLWMVFSHAWATCLPEQESKELWGPRFKQMFFREFLAPLEDRWKNFSPLLTELQIIAGDYDVRLIHDSLPICMETAYAINDLEQLQLVRPIRMAEVSAGVARFQNRKLG